MSGMQRFRVSITTPDGAVYLDVWAESEAAALAFGDRIVWADPVTDRVTPITCKRSADRSK